MPDYKSREQQLIEMLMDATNPRAGDEQEFADYLGQFPPYPKRPATPPAKDILLQLQALKQKELAGPGLDRYTHANVTGKPVQRRKAPAPKK